MAAAASSTAAVLGGAAARFPPAASRNNVKAPLPVLSSSLQRLPRPSSLAFSTSFTHEAQRFSSLRARATSTDETSPDALLSDLKEKWDGIENKSTVFTYGGGAIVAVWLSSILVGAVNSVPLLPKIMELVGLGYTGWFVYRYLLFKSNRKELAEDIDALKKKIAGTE